MKKIFLTTALIVASLMVSTNVGAQNTRPQMKRQKVSTVGTIQQKAVAAEKVDVQKAVDAKTEATPVKAQENKCDGCKKGEGKCDKTAAQAEKKDCCKEKALKAEDGKKCEGCKKGEGKCDKAAAQAEKKNCCKEKK